MSLSLIVEDYSSSFYYDDESHPSISVLIDGTIVTDIFITMKIPLNRAKLVYNIMVDNLKLKYFERK